MFLIRRRLTRFPGRVATALALALLAPVAVLSATQAPADAAAVSGNYTCGNNYSVPSTITVNGVPSTMYVGETAPATGTARMTFPPAAESYLRGIWRNFTIPTGQPLAGTTWPVQVNKADGAGSIPATFGNSAAGLILSMPKETMTNVFLLDPADGWTWNSPTISMPLTAPSTPGIHKVTFGNFTLKLGLYGDLFFNEVPLGPETWPCSAPAGGLTVASVTVRSRSHVSFVLNPDVVQQGTRASAQATVTVDGGQANGTVTFFNVATNAVLGTATVTNGVVPATQLALLPAGEHEIGARFTPSSSQFYDASVATDTRLLTVKPPADTATTLTVSPLNILTTGSATATAEVTSATGTPVGSVIFTVDGQDRPAVPLSQGKASLTLSGLGKGMHPVVARFVPDNPNVHNPSSSLTRTLEVTKLADPSHTAVTFSSNPAYTTDTVSATATVAIDGGATPIGAIQWTVVGKDPGSQVFDQFTSPITGASATLDLSYLPEGHYDVTADFEPKDLAEQAISADTKSIEVKIPPATTTTTSLTLSKASVWSGESVTATAHVAPASPRPSGSVVFSINGVAQDPVALVDGTASLAMPSLAAGTYRVTARFVPLDLAAFSPSEAGEQTVVATDKPPVTTTTTLALAPATINEEQASTLTATTTAAEGTLSGTVEFTLTPASGPALTYTRPFRAGGTTLLVDGLTPGSYTAKAKFVPADNTFVGSTSAPATLTVQAAPAATTQSTLSLSRTSALTTDVVSATVTVASTRGRPVGKVEFSYGTHTILVDVANGVATTTLTGLVLGPNQIKARFVPTDPARFLESTATPKTVTVDQAPARASVTTLMLSRNTAPSNVSVLATAQVASSLGTPEGLVIFRVGTTEVGRVALVDGAAELPLAGLTVATHDVTATFQPRSGSNILGSSDIQTLTIVAAPGPAPSTTVVTLSDTAILLGHSSVATVTVQSSGAAPVGKVQIGYRGTTTDVDLDNGQAKLTLSGDVVGNHPVTATFLPSGADVASSTATPLTLVVAAKDAAASSTRLRLSHSEATVTETVDAVATVASTVGIAPGEVVFTFDGTSVRAPVDPRTGLAKATLPPLGVGSHPVVATYVPQDPALIAGSFSPSVPLRVVASSAVALTVTPTTAGQGTAVDVVATVTAFGGTTSGVVTFQVGGQERRVVVAAGTATLRLPDLAPGDYQVVAVFAPTDTAMRGATSRAQALTITPGAGPTVTRPASATTTSLTLERYSAAYGARNRATARVTQGATGAVWFTIGSFSQDVPVTGGLAVIDLPRDLPVGAQALKATFVPDKPAAYKQSDASTFLTVTRDQTKMRVKKHLWTNTSVLRLRVKVHAAAGSLPTGKVKLQVLRGKKRVAVRTVTLDCNGFVVTKVPLKGSGRFTVRATYEGSKTLRPTTSTITQKVGR